MKHFKTYRDFYILNYLLIITYYLFFNHLGIDIESGIMFTTYDSTTYVHTSNEFYKLSETGFSNFRPFLYPLILLIVLKGFGVTALWLMQVCFWFVSINLVFHSVKIVTQNKILSYSGSLIMALNFSYIGLTMQCLTEVTALLLISMLIYFVSCNSRHFASLKFFQGSLFILVLLSVLKPVFFLPVLFMVIIVLPFFYLKEYIKAPRKIAVLLVILSPLFYQIMIMKVKYDTFSVSQISSETFRNYLLAQGVKEIDNTTWEDARQKATGFTSDEVSSCLLDNKGIYTKLYLQNLKDNLTAFPSFLIGPRGFIYTGLGRYMTITNTVYFCLHLIFILPLLYILYRILRKKQWDHYFVSLVFPGVLTCYIFLTSPVSFGEGDRLVITAMPAWIFLYTLVVNYFLKKSKGKSVGIAD
ncbi:MAG: hypothetical protein WAQ28_07560 [Bacteroidia bacterium]